MKRRSPTTASALVAALLVGRSAAAQSPPPAACPPTFELSGSIPPRVAQRLRRALDHAATALPTHAACQPSRARLEWNARELTIHISLDDGRIAVRNLESLEDLLPTLLSVLAVPASDAAPVAPDATPDAAPEAPAAPPAPVVVPAPPPVAIVRPAPPPPRRSAWSLLVSGTIGATYSDDDLSGRWTAEVGAATPRFALTLRAGMSFQRGNNNDREDVPLGSRLRLQDSQGRTQSFMVLSARARWGIGRLSIEAGGFGGVSHDAAAEPSRWLPRLGVEASVGWHFTRSLGVFVRAEGAVDVGADRDPALALSLGLAWEPHR